VLSQYRPDTQTRDTASYFHEKHVKERFYRMRELRSLVSRGRHTSEATLRIINIQSPTTIYENYVRSA